MCMCKPVVSLLLTFANIDMLQENARARRACVAAQALRMAGTSQMLRVGLHAQVGLMRNVQPVCGVMVASLEDWAWEV